MSERPKFVPIDPGDPRSVTPMGLTDEQSARLLNAARSMRDIGGKIIFRSPEEIAGKPPETKELIVSMNEGAVLHAQDINAMVQRHRGTTPDTQPDDLS